MGTIAPYAWFDGSIVPWAEARIHASYAAVNRGANVFEGVRAYWNDDVRELYLFRNDDHLARLRRSAKIMRMAMPWSDAALTQAQIDALQANRIEETAWYRLAIYVGDGDGVWPPEDQRVGGFLLPQRLPRSPQVEGGIDVCVSTWARINDADMPPRVKAGANYHNARLAVMEARTNGYHQPILLNERGKVAEGPGSCFCMVRGGVLIAPPPSSNLLESITLDSVATLWRDEIGLATAEREIDRTELYVADEAFLLGTMAEILPIRSVDRYAVGSGAPGPLTRRLQALYFAAVEGRIEKYRKWLTPVYGRVGAAG